MRLRDKKERTPTPLVHICSFFQIVVKRESKGTPLTTTNHDHVTWFIPWITLFI